MFASTSTDFGPFLFSIVSILLAARVGGELAERLKVPSVLGEILAGIAIGPSALGLVEVHDVLTSDAITVLAELGVLLLLLQVGMEMDLAELGKVGASSMTVAIIGVALPMAGGTAAAIAMGQDTKTAIFVGAALTATSVGITARVFGDLKALSSTESRIVLGAAVADDVLGLVILTVVVKIVTEGSVGFGTVAGTFGLAVAFLVVSGAVGLAGAPRLFDLVQRTSRSSAAVPVLAFVVLFLFAGFANLAKLAPIIGAFMAGLALGRTRHHERIHHDSTAIGNLLMPVFFVQIGLNTDVSVMGDPGVIGVAAVLLVIAILGKLLAALGVFGVRADRLLVGLGMIPRGEVGLIFASIGLSNGVLDDELYASLIIVMLVTTLITPPALRWRLTSPASRPPAILDDPDGPVPEPTGGWFDVGGGTIELAATPSSSRTVPIVLQAAALAAEVRPGSSLLDWIADRRTHPLAWDRGDTPALVELAGAGSPTALRFLEVSGVLERALPEVADHLQRRRHDTSELDPSRILRFPSAERLDALISEDDPVAAKAAAGLDSLDLVRVAALAHDVCPLDLDARRALLDRLVGPEGSPAVIELLDDAALLGSAAGDPDSFDQQRMLHLAHHLVSEARTLRSHLLVLATSELAEWRRQALDELVAKIIDIQRHQRRVGSGDEALVASRKRLARQSAVSDVARERIDAAGDAYVLSHDPDELARHARLIEPLPGRGMVRVAVTPLAEPGRWQVEVAFRDDRRALSRLAESLTDHGLDIVRAGIATWPDGAALHTYVVEGSMRPSARELAESFEHRGKRTLAPVALTDAEMSFDATALPWHTSLTVTCVDEPGVLQSLSKILADCGAIIADARITTDGSTAVDRFALTDRRGQKLDPATVERITNAVRAASRSITTTASGTRAGR